MDNIRFEEAREAYLDEILEIYRYYVLHTSATFHTVVPSLDEMRELLFIGHPVYRAYVILDRDLVCGYVILARHKEREAYDRTGEVSVYLRADYFARGIGSLAVRHIEKYAVDIGLHVLIATICGENSQSINLFERNGFIKCAHYIEIGQKFGQYLDVVAYQKILEDI